MMKVWAGLVAVALYCAACCAQAPPALKSVIGEVTAIDAASKQIKLKGDDGAAYTVTLSDTTSFLRIPPGEKDLKKLAKSPSPMLWWATALSLAAPLKKTPRPCRRARSSS
jgi:hypothetical protein